MVNLGFCYLFFEALVVMFVLLKLMICNSTLAADLLCLNEICSKHGA